MLGIEYVQYWKGVSRKQRKCHGICIDVSDYLGLITFFMPERKKVALFLFVVTNMYRSQYVECTYNVEKFFKKNSANHGDLALHTQCISYYVAFIRRCFFVILKVSKRFLYPALGPMINNSLLNSITFRLSEYSRNAFCQKTRFKHAQLLTYP